MPFQNDEDSCLSSYLWIFFFSFQMLVGKTGSKDGGFAILFISHF